MTNMAEIKTAMGKLRRRVEDHCDERYRVCKDIEYLIYDIDTIAERKVGIPAESPLGKIIVELKEWLDYEESIFEVRAKMGIMFENIENKINWEE